MADRRHSETGSNRQSNSGRWDGAEGRGIITVGAKKGERERKGGDEERESNEKEKCCCLSERRDRACVCGKS